jgi:ribosomal protein S18
MDKFKMEMHWNQSELEQWVLASKQKEEDNLVVQKYARMDEAKIRELTNISDKLQRQLTAAKTSLENEVTNTQAAQIDDEFGGGEDKDKKMHSKRKSCWFSAMKTSPDWKDPKSYSWLVNEFGKISPARITGLTPTFQRRANEAIKRGRNMLLISYQSNETAR